MASGSQADPTLWLHNKLGTSNDSWTGGSIVSQLNPEILVKIQHCFMDLQPQVKLKLLLSILSIGRRNLETWKAQLDRILDVASEDSEPWVCMLAQLMKTLPETGQLTADITTPEANRKIFHDLLTDLKKGLKKNAEKQHKVLPLECLYLNKNAFLSVVGSQPQGVKHFTLRRKPRAAALKAELSNKSVEAANKIKSASQAGGFPIRKSTMPGKMSDMPMKGLPSRPLALGGFRNPRVSLPNRQDRRKESGVKMLDINEQPIGFAAMKKRRKQEQEEAKKLAQEEAQKAAAEKASKKEKKNQAAAVAPTPDYAAALNPPATPAAAAAGVAGATPAYAPPTPMQTHATPSYAPTNLQPAANLVPLPIVSSQNSAVVVTQPQSIIVMQNQQGVQMKSNQVVNSQHPQQQQLQQQQHQQQMMKPGTIMRSAHQIQPIIKSAAAPFPTSLGPLPPSAIQVRPATLRAQLPAQPLPQSAAPVVVSSQQIPQQQMTARLVQLPTQPIPQSSVVQMQNRAGAPTVLIGQPRATSIIPSGLQPQNLAGARIVRPVQQQVASRPVVMPAANLQPNPPPPQANAPAQRRNLTLTRDQMAEAQEMFKTANKVTRPEKALILGFMAGSRENPCPHLGNVVTIKLSENQENVPQTDGAFLTMIVETHFQMNYLTGEWKRIKKYRKIED